MTREDFEKLAKEYLLETWCGINGTDSHIRPVADLLIKVHNDAIEAAAGTCRINIFANVAMNEMAIKKAAAIRELKIEEGSEK